MHWISSMDIEIEYYELMDDKDALNNGKIDITGEQEDDKEKFLTLYKAKKVKEATPDQQRRLQKFKGNCSSVPLIVSGMLWWQENKPTLPSGKYVNTRKAIQKNRPEAMTKYLNDIVRDGEKRQRGHTESNERHDWIKVLGEAAKAAEAAIPVESAPAIRDGPESGKCVFSWEEYKKFNAAPTAPGPPTSSEVEERCNAVDATGGGAQECSKINGCAWERSGAAAAKLGGAAHSAASPAAKADKDFEMLPYIVIRRLIEYCPLYNPTRGSSEDVDVVIAEVTAAEKDAGGLIPDDDDDDGLIPNDGPGGDDGGEYYTLPNEDGGDNNTLPRTPAQHYQGLASLVNASKPAGASGGQPARRGRFYRNRGVLP